MRLLQQQSATMDLASKIGLSLIAVSCLVVGFGLVLIRFYTPESITPAILDTDWISIEETVEKDIGLVGYQFLTRGGAIPALEPGEFEACLNTYAELRQADRTFNREYLFKYNQIVRIRMLRAGIDCSE
jgi:hypothetical protein